MDSIEKVCDMDGVREYWEEDTVELHRNRDTQRLMVVAFFGGGYNCVEIDLFDLLSWVANNKEKCDAGVSD